MTTQRKEINKEQFFTNFKTAERLSEFLKEQDWFEEVETIIEPSAGDGAWLGYLDVDLAYDIDPKHDDVIKVDDFLTYNVKKDIKKIEVQIRKYQRIAAGRIPKSLRTT